MSPNALTHCPDAAGAAAKGALDFLVRLTEARDTHHQLRATLEVVRDAAGADAVCLYGTDTGVISELVEGPCFGAPFGGEAVRRIFAELPAGEAHVLQGRWGAGGGHRPVRSAAQVRLSKWRGLWVVALRHNTEAPFTARELKVMVLAKRLVQQQASQGQLRDPLVNVVRCLTSALDARNPYTRGHSERVARIAVRLAGAMGLPEPAASEVYLAGLLHDVGKICVPDQVLRKPGRLTDEELAQVKEHVLIGEAIIRQAAELAPLAPAVRGHHEHYDGKGYPDGLRGEAIPPAARLLAVADACDAMMSDRPYRQALPQERIIATLIQGAGRQWAPDVIEAFLACRGEVFPICQPGHGDSQVRAIGELPDAPGSLLLSRRLSD